MVDLLGEGLGLIHGSLSLLLPPLSFLRHVHLLIHSDRLLLGLSSFCLHLVSLDVFVHLDIFTGVPLVSGCLTAVLRFSFLGQSLCWRACLTQRRSWTRERRSRGRGGQRRRRRVSSRSGDGLRLSTRGQGDDLKLPRRRRRALKLVGGGQRSELLGQRTALHPGQRSAGGRSLKGRSSGVQGGGLSRRRRPLTVRRMKPRSQRNGSDRRVQSCKINK